MTGKIINHHYTECGLPNVWIRCRQIIDDAGEKAIIISNIGSLHKTIAHKIVVADGALTGAEIKFLRSEMGWTQAQLAEIVHCQRLTISRWENGESTINGAADSFIRMLAIDKLKLNKLAAEKISRKYKNVSNEKSRKKIPIQIGGVNVARCRLAA